jgi:hypothetical protein
LAGGGRDSSVAGVQLSLLGTTVVLDDQLVQSDDMRMDWFRKLLAEKARAFKSSCSRAGQPTIFQRAQ